MSVEHVVEGLVSDGAGAEAAGLRPAGGAGSLLLMASRPTPAPPRTAHWENSVQHRSSTLLLLLLLHTLVLLLLLLLLALSFTGQPSCTEPFPLCPPSFLF